MQGDDSEVADAAGEMPGLPGSRQRVDRRDRPAPVAQQRIDHHVADEAHALALDALARQILAGDALGRIEPVGNLVGQDTGFESDENEVILALRSGELIEIPRASKREIAQKILDQVMRLRIALVK